MPIISGTTTKNIDPTKINMYFAAKAALTMTMDVT